MRSIRKYRLVYAVITAIASLALIASGLIYLFQ